MDKYLGVGLKQFDCGVSLELSLVFLPIKIILKRVLEGFLVRFLVSLTKNPSRNRFNVILMTKKTRF